MSLKVCAGMRRISSIRPSLYLPASFHDPFSPVPIFATPLCNTFCLFRCCFWVLSYLFVRGYCELKEDKHLLPIEFYRVLLDLSKIVFRIFSPLLYQLSYSATSMFAMVW